MKLDIGLLADAATERFGQLNILGTFEVIHVSAFPAVHPHCALVLRIAAHPTETGNHTFRIMLRDSDGRPVQHPDGSSLEIQGGFTVEQKESAAWMEPSIPIVLGLTGLYLPRPDTYTFFVLVDDRHLGDVPFHAVIAQQQAA